MRDKNVQQEECTIKKIQIQLIQEYAMVRRPIRDDPDCKPWLSLKYEPDPKSMIKYPNLWV